MGQDIRAESDKAHTRGTMVLYEDAAKHGAGWIGFAAIMLGLVGTWTVLEGIMAIGKSRVYVGDQHFVAGDLQAWGWIMLILGALVLVAAFGIASGNQLARFFGIFAAGINLIGQLFFASANPWWSLAMFSVNVLILYGLIVYGGQRFEES